MESFRPLFRARLLAAMGCAMLVGAGCGRPGATGIVVRVTSDLQLPAEIAGVRITLVNGAGKSVHDETILHRTDAPLSLPLFVAFSPQGKGLGPVTIEATGVTMAGNTTVVSRRATLTFQRERVVLLDLPLMRICKGTVCGEGTTCGEGGRCREQFVPVQELATYGGPGMLLPPPPDAAPAATPDAAGNARGDGGVDAPDDVRKDGPADAPTPVPDVTGAGPDAADAMSPPPLDAPPPDTAGGTAARCTSAADCTNGFCVDGVCCSTACNESCKACSQAKTGRPDGECAAVSSGTDPDDECTPDPANPCGPDGMCNGAGACRVAELGVVCAAAACDGNTYTQARQCDGKGVCQAARSESCGLYTCTNAGCRATCAGDMDCVSPNRCVNGMCGGKRANGAGCALGVECSSGHCVDSVCCGTPCDGPCEACSQAKNGTASGVCAPIAAGMDPDNECPLEAQSSCGYDGSCNGAGACRRYLMGTECSPAMCSAGAFTPARHCDGVGTCSTVNPMGCGAYVCATSGCRTSCTSDADCASPNTCIGSTCGQKKANGAICAAGTECTSGHCVEGICCGTACTGTCMSCRKDKTGQSDGACHPVTGGTDPDNECADQGAATCGTDGSCNGSGGCRLYGAGTVCASGGCVGNTFVGTSNCDGQGVCAPGSGMPCGAYACSAGGCKSSCSTNYNGQDPDCAPNHGCKTYTTQCGPLDGTWTFLGYWAQSSTGSTTTDPTGPCVRSNVYLVKVADTPAGAQMLVFRSSADDANCNTIRPGTVAYRIADSSVIRQCGTTAPTWSPVLGREATSSSNLRCLPESGASVWSRTTDYSLTCSPSDAWVSKFFECR